MFELEQVCNENLSHYKEYKKVFEIDLKQYQSRIYPSENAEILRWYHIKTGNKYIGAIWLEKNANDDFAVLGVFIAYELYRNKGIGKAAIEQIIKTDFQYMHTNKILLRVREENERAVRCYKSVGFKENRRYEKGNLNVIEMIYECNNDYKI
ncbi:MAG: GNAT family N-acetyltransferase [Clostridia bacterium]|nr:GNAT family N-acetyltransferase [Clostridia bacterium]